MRKHNAAMLALLFCGLAVLSALAAGATLKLSASDPVAQQAAAFRGYLDKLSPEHQAQWREEMQGMLESPEGLMAMQLYGQPDDATAYVYMVSSGKVYHLHRDCSTLSRSKNVQEVTLEQAQLKGRRPCKVCGGT